MEMIGKVFGRLTVLRRGRSNQKHLWWSCICSCPLRTKKQIRGDGLRSGAVVSCGCYRLEAVKALGYHYKPGRKFARLTIVKETGTVKKRGPIYLCRCVCGKRVTVQGRHLRSGESRSCGCLYRDTRATANRTHGKAPSSHKIAVYSCYGREKSLCRNPNMKHYEYYGGRGIEFRFTSFQEFYAEVGDKPNNDCWLMRIDRDGHFEPGNMQWVPRNNRSKFKSKR
jgi:hypothetical protein